MGYGYYTRIIDGIERRAGYSVVCICDKPGCDEDIDRGLDFLCGRDPGETEFGCGRYFCHKHRSYRTYGRGKAAETVLNCSRCRRGKPPYPMKLEPDLARSWAQLSDELRTADYLRQEVRTFLKDMEARGVDDRYIASLRRAFEYTEKR